MDLAWRLSGALALGFSLAGCGLGGFADIASGYTCAKPDYGFIDPATGIPDPCHERTPWPDAGADAGDPSCAGVCVPSPAANFDVRAFLVWIGPIGTAPECPSALQPNTHGYMDLEKPAICPTCTCEPPTGSCGLPATIAGNAAACQDVNPSTPQISFNPPLGWNGSCTTDNPLPATACPGPDCVESLSFGELTVNEVAQCTPAEIPIPHKIGDAYFKTEVTLCDSDLGECALGRCTLPAPPGWRICTTTDNAINDCPKEYPEEHIIYKNPPDDQRDCNPCTCGAPVGSECHGCIYVYQDKTCSVIRSCLEVSSAQTKCADIAPAGKALFSKKAGTITYTPGTCQPMGGEEIGDVNVQWMARVCCQAP